MDIENLNELVTLSNELAELRGKPAPSPVALPQSPTLHPALASVLKTGALVFQGVDPSRMNEFSTDARGRGMRRNAVVFGWHPKGHTWFAATENYGSDAVVLIIDRLNRLTTKEVSISELVDHCIEDTRATIAEVKLAAEDKRVIVPGGHSGPFVPDPLMGRRPVRVVLPESDGAHVVADGRTEEFTGEELAYIRWCMSGLQIVSDGNAPDLSRWEARCLRSCRIESVPAEGDADRSRYDENWSRLTLRDRSAPGPVHHQVASFKFSAPGSWILAPNESEVLRRADMSTPPRHAPTADQKAIWAKWMSLVKAEVVELHVR